MVLMKSLVVHLSLRKESLGNQKEVPHFPLPMFYRDFTIKVMIMITNVIY